MNVTDRILYFGVWGTIFGFALYYGWRIAFGIVGSFVIQLGQLLFGDEITFEFNYVFAGLVINGLVNALCGIIVGVGLSLLIRVILKPTSMSFSAVPSAICLGVGYWWLVEALYEGSIHVDSDVFLISLPGPVIVVACFLATYRFIALPRPNKRLWRQDPE